MDTIQAAERALAERPGDAAAVEAYWRARARATGATTIQAHAVYPPHDGGPVRVTRAAAANYLSPIGEPWPTLAVGALVEVHDLQGWRWRGEVVAVNDADTVRVALIGERAALPMPEVRDGSIVLPNMSGHAHARRWRAGDIVRLGDAVYRVVGKPRPLGGRLSYRLVEVDEAKWATRPGRVSLPSERAALDAVGSAVQVGSEWLHVTGAKYVTHRHDGMSSRTWAGHGKFVSEARARTLNAVHGPSLSRALHAAPAARVTEPLPEDAVVLLPRRSDSLAATGERLAVSGRAVLHERVGDPDMSDSWHHYVVRIEDAALLARAKKFVAKAKKAKATR